MKKRELNYESARKRKIIILVGRGKSILTEWSLATKIKYPSAQELQSAKYEAILKTLVDGNNLFLHLASEKLLKNISPWLRRNSLIFKIDIL